MRKLLVLILFFAVVSETFAFESTLDLTDSKWELFTDESCSGNYINAEVLSFKANGLLDGRFREGRWVTIRNWGMGFSMVGFKQSYLYTDFVGHVDSATEMHGDFTFDGYSTPPTPHYSGCWKAIKK